MTRGFGPIAPVRWCVVHSSVSPDYFATLGTEIVGGRSFAATDDTLHPRVAIVNRKAAETLWPGKEPLGQQFRFEADGPPVMVVGVARDGRYNFLLEPPQPFIYLPFAQQKTVGEGFLAIRTTGDPHALDGPVRALFKNASPDFVPAGFLSLEDVIHDGPNALLIFRLGAVSATILGIVSLFLTLVGLYGVMSVGVTQRTRELGVQAGPRRHAGPGAPRRIAPGGAAGRSRRRRGDPALRRSSGDDAESARGRRRRQHPGDRGSGVDAGVAAMAAAYPSARRASRLDPVGALRAD